MNRSDKSVLITLINRYRLLNDRRAEASRRIIDFIIKYEISDEEIFDILLLIDPAETKARGTLKAIRKQVDKIKVNHEH